MNDKTHTDSIVKPQPKDQRLPAGELDQDQLEQASGGMNKNDLIQGVVEKPGPVRR
jgi:hypothetical protein